jgi:hypothetical protein
VAEPALAVVVWVVRPEAARVARLEAGQVVALEAAVGCERIAHGHMHRFRLSHLSLSISRVMNSVSHCRQQLLLPIDPATRSSLLQLDGREAVPARITS